MVLLDIFFIIVESSSPLDKTVTKQQKEMCRIRNFSLTEYLVILMICYGFVIQDSQTLCDQNKTELEPPGDIPFEPEKGKNQTLSRAQPSAEKTKKKGTFWRKKKKVHFSLILQIIIVICNLMSTL